MKNYFPIVSIIIFALTVVVLGILTPGYNHLSHTISRLAIMKYGWIQALNLIQFSLGLYAGGIALSHTMKTNEGKLTLRNIFFFCAILVILTAITKTDPIENIRVQLNMLSPMGIAHLGIVLMFLLISPFGIIRLSKILALEPGYRDFSTVTRVVGFAALTASIVWFVFYFLGVFLEYRGMFQKIIVLWTIVWMVLLHIRALSLSRAEST